MASEGGAMTAIWPDHLLTVEEWEQLPEDERFRLELVDGVLSIVPKPLWLHQRASMRLGHRLDEQLPPELTAVLDVEILVDGGPLTIRVPDVVVTRSTIVEENPARVPAGEMLLAVEVLSDGTRKVDRILKFAEYAEAGIPQYWIVDLDEPTTLLAYVLVDGAYELSGEHTGTAALDVAGHRVALELPALVRR
jgi:Uma2 family endonuclease